MPTPLEQYKNVLHRCSFCGRCQSVCPVYAISGDEMDGPRSRVMLLRNLVNGTVNPENIARYMVRCTLCGKCERACPTSLPLLKIFACARSALRHYLYIPTRMRFFHALSSHPSILARLQKLLGLMHKYLPGYAEKLGLPFYALTCGHVPEPCAENKGLPALRRGRALLFPGCVSARVFPSVVAAYIGLLNNMGIEVIIPENLVCCGRPAAICGDKKLMKRLAAQNMEIMAAVKFDWLLSPCPGCLSSMTQYWPMAGLPAVSIKELVRRIVDMSNLVSRFYPEKAQRKQLAIIWQQPCLTGRNDAESIRHLLAGVGQVQDMEICCGAPLSCLEWPERDYVREDWTGRELMGEEHDGLKKLGRALSSSFCNSLMSARADVVATACPGCMLQIEKGLAGKGASMPARHWVEIYLEAAGSD